MNMKTSHVLSHVVGERDDYGNTTRLGFNFASVDGDEAKRIKVVAAFDVGDLAEKVVSNLRSMVSLIEKSQARIKRKK